MKIQVEFRSSKFPPYEGEEEQINPGLWGKRLAEYLARKQADKGIATSKQRRSTRMCSTEGQGVFAVRWTDCEPPYGGGIMRIRIRTRDTWSIGRNLLDNRRLSILFAPGILRG